MIVIRASFIGYAFTLYGIRASEQHLLYGIRYTVYGIRYTVYDLVLLGWRGSLRCRGRSTPWLMWPHTNPICPSLTLRS